MKRIATFILALLLSVTSTAAVTRYVRVDGSDSNCSGLSDAADPGTGTIPRACAFQTPGHVAGGGNGGVGVAKACGDVFIFVHTNANGPTRFFAAKKSSTTALYTNYNSPLEISPSGPTNCNASNRIRWTSSTGNAADVIITSFVKVDNTISNVGGSFGNVWKWTNDRPGLTEYVGSFTTPGPLPIWPLEIKQTAPAANLTKIYVNGDDYYNGFPDAIDNSESCLTGPDITADNAGLESVNARHNTWLCGAASGSDRSLCASNNNPGTQVGNIVYFHPQTNAVLANGAQDPDVAPIGNGGNPLTEGFVMMKRVRNYTLLASDADGYEFDHLTFEGPTRFGGDYTYVHDNVLKGQFVEILDARNSITATKGGFTGFRFENNIVRGRVSGSAADMSFDRSQADMEIVGNRMTGGQLNQFTFKFMRGTAASPMYIARNHIGPGRIWLKSATGYNCQTGEWNSDGYVSHGLYIGEAAVPAQAISYFDFYDNIITGTSDGLGLFWGDHLTFDGTLFATYENGVDYAANGANTRKRVQHLHFCGTGGSGGVPNVTFRNTVYYGDANWNTTQEQTATWLLGSAAAGCVSATTWPSFSYSLYLHPDTSGTLKVVKDGRTGSTCYGGCTLAQAIAEGLESDTSREIDTGSSGMIDPTYTGHDFRLAASDAPQVDEGHPTLCGHGVCDGGADDGEACNFRTGDCPSGTCVIDGTACDQGAYEYLLPTVIPPVTPTIRLFSVTCSQASCVGIVDTEGLPTEGNGPYDVEFCYRTNAAGCIDNDAEYDLATCVTLADPIANTRNYVVATGLNAATLYCFGTKVINDVGPTESTLTAATRTTASTTSANPFVDCSNVATVQAYITDICDGDIDANLSAGTEAVDCDVAGESVTWATGVTIPETCQKTLTDVAITFDGREVRIDGPDAAPTFTIQGSSHTLTHFNITNTQKGVLLDHGVAGPSFVTLDHVNVTSPTVNCFEQEDLTGAQGVLGGNNYTDTTCCTSPVGYSINGIATNVAAHTEKDATFTRAICENCGVAFDFTGSGRYGMEESEVYTTTDSTQQCTTGIDLDSTLTYLTMARDTISDCDRGISLAGNSHARLDDVIVSNNKVAGIYVTGADTRVVGEDVVFDSNGGAISSPAVYGGLALASNIAVLKVSFGSNGEADLDITAVAPDGITQNTAGRAKFYENRSPTGLRDVHNATTSSYNIEGACYTHAGDSNPNPQVFSTDPNEVDFDPIWTACGGPVSGEGSATYSPSGTVYLSRTLLGGPSTAGQPMVVAAGTSGDDACVAASLVCQAATLNTTLAATTCASTTGERTVLCN